MIKLISNQFKMLLKFFLLRTLVSDSGYDSKFFQALISNRRARVPEKEPELIPDN